MSIIICPNCKTALQQVEKTMRCANGHTFDYAKEGYINLLLANQKRKLNPGDNKMMANAREAFLSTGHYDFLLKHIESKVESMNTVSIPKGGAVQFLDLGCGTGYYTRNLYTQKKYRKIGIDISKIAIAKAAAKDKKSTYIVSSIFNVPIEDNAIDLVANIFAPIDLKVMKRVLKPGGYFIKVIPTGDHMKEVARLIYKEFIPHQSAIKEEVTADAMFEICNAEIIQKNISLSGEILLNFISMTPYFYKFEKAQLDSLMELSVTISFEVIMVKYDGI